MKIKSLLLGSAAAVVAVTGVRAADAVVIPEPELVEYVRVCDTYGTGFFYIPGTETCMQIGGYVRYQIDIGERGIGGGLDINAQDGFFLAGPPQDQIIASIASALGFADDDPNAVIGGVSFFGNGNAFQGGVPGFLPSKAVVEDWGWTQNTSADLNIDVRSETELGTLRGFIGIEMGATTETVNVDQVFIELGGLHMGYSDNAFDGGIVGEADSLGGAKVNRIAYTFASGAFDATLSIDDDNAPTDVQDFEPNVSANIGYDAGMFDARLFGAYDSTTDEWAGKAVVGVDVSDAGRLELAAYYTSGATYVFTGTTSLGLSASGVAALATATGDPTMTAGYATGIPLFSEWSIQAGYEHQITEKFKLTGTGVYWDNVAHFSDLGPGFSADAWALGLVADYEIVENLDMKVSVTHVDTDVDIPGFDDIFDSATSGFVRFERSF